MLDSSMRLVIVCVRNIKGQPETLLRIPSTSYASNSDPVSLTRTFCGGLMAPTMATLFGKFLFKRIHSNFQRCILVSINISPFAKLNLSVYLYVVKGGIAYLTIKGALRMYYQQKQYYRQAHRKIVDLETEQNATSSTNEPNRDMEQI